MAKGSLKTKGSPKTKAETMGQRWANKESALKRYRKSFGCSVRKPISRLHPCRYKSRLCDTGIYFTGFIKRRLTAVVEIATDFPSKNFVTRSRTLTLYWSSEWLNIIRCVVRIFMRNTCIILKTLHSAFCKVFRINGLLYCRQHKNWKDLMIALKEWVIHVCTTRADYFQS